MVSGNAPKPVEVIVIATAMVMAMASRRVRAWVGGKLTSVLIGELCTAYVPVRLERGAERDERRPRRVVTTQPVGGRLHEMMLLLGFVMCWAGG